MLDLKRVEVVYHSVSMAIQGVSFKLNQGEIFALIGANGAGKTTTLRAISGFLGSDDAKITDGEVIFMGKKLNGKQPHEITREGIVLVPERRKVFETLTTEENLAISVFRGENYDEAVELVYHYFPSLYERRKHLAGYLSGGERQMLAIGQGFLCSPKLLLLDELSQGLAPIVVEGLIETLEQMKKEVNLTILIVEQNAQLALNFANNAAVMENGRIVLSGTAQRLLSHGDVKEFYLGVREGLEKEGGYLRVRQYHRSRKWWG
jgi:branched-chain amino acid transport system ATP-binding protein